MKSIKHLFLAVLLVFGLVGCSSGQSSSGSSTGSDTGNAPAAAEAEHFVGFSAMTFGDNWMVNTDAKLKEICDAKGFKYTAMGAEGVAATQVNQIENMVTQGCDIILITPLDIDALHDTIKAASEKGVTCVYIGDPYAGEDPFCICLNVDQREFGSQAAKAAAEWIDATYPDAADGSVEVAVFQNSSNDAFVLRADGLHDVEKFTKKAKIVETYDLVGQSNANAMCQEYTDQLLMKHPDVKAIVSHSSDFGNAIDEVIMRTASVDPTTMGIFADDWLQAAADAVKSSKDGGSAFRAFIDSGEAAQAFMEAALGELEMNDQKQAMMKLYTFTADNIDEAYALHK
ncbi:MAG: substrate-binding domain-containing protein [Solobacterium sp.]|nr:substrate-binding domain-containing protein [Solobacterium sp.]